jgi:hypothetical protein
MGLHMEGTKMVRVTIMAREPGDTKPEFSLIFELPELPRPGDYISVHYSDQQTPHTEDFVVRHVWWRLETTETRAVVPAGDERVGKLGEIFVECEMALGPWATDKWYDAMQLHRQKGKVVEEFKLARLSVRERDLPSEN